MQVTCPTCEAVLKAPEDIAGKKVKCNKCESVFRIPVTDFVPATTALPPVPQISREAVATNKPETYRVGIVERFIKAAYVFTGYWVSEKPPPLPSKAATINKASTTDRFIKAAFALTGFWATELLCEWLIPHAPSILIALAVEFIVLKSPLQSPKQNQPLLRMAALGYAILFVGLSALFTTLAVLGCIYSNDPRFSNPFVRGFTPIWFLVLISVPYYTMQPGTWRERWKQNPQLFALCVLLFFLYIVSKSQIESKGFQPTKPLPTQFSALVLPQPKVISTTDNKYAVTLVAGWQQVNEMLKDFGDKLGDAKLGILGPDNVICWMDEEPRKDFLSVSLEQYAETRSKIMSQSVSGDMTDAKISPLTALTLDHFPARRFEVHGVANNNQVVLTMTIIETADDFCRIMVWASQNAFDKNRSDAEKIIASFNKL